MKPIVLVTQLQWEKAEAVFRAADDLDCRPAPEEEAELAFAVATAGARAAIVGVRRYAGPLYEAMGRRAPAMLARFGVGHDGIDKALARRHGIAVTNAPGVLETSVAEHALWLIGALARKIPQLHAAVRRGEWAAAAGIELSGKTLGVLGYGAIGRRLAAMAAGALGMRVVACDRFLPAAPRADGIRLTTSAEEMFEASDVVSVHLSAGPDTDRFVNERRLARLQPGALLVNTARGSVVDEAALYDALVSGRLGGAALDVFENEPYRPADPPRDLRTLPNVILTPHVGSNTSDCNRRIAAAALDNVRAFFAGRLDRMTRVDGSG